MRLFSPSRVKNIFICMAVVFCASSSMTAAFASVRPRMKASGAISISPVCMRAFDDAAVHHIIKRVIDRTQIRIDLLAHVAGQEAEPFAGLHRRSRQHDAIDFLALEYLHRMRDREPGLARARGSLAEHQRVAHERADIRVLRGVAGAHRALAQIDFLKGGAAAARLVIEQRALRDRLSDGAFDVALRQIAAALEMLVEPFQHAAGLLAGAARAVDGDVVAALLGDDAEPALDQGEVGGIGRTGLRPAGCPRRRGRSAWWPFLPKRAAGGSAVSGVRKGVSGSCFGLLRRAGVLLERAKQGVAADFCNGHRNRLADQRRRCHDLYCLQIWGAADQLPREPAGLFQQHVNGAADERGVVGALLAGDE